MLARAWPAAKMVPAVLAWFVCAVLLVGAGASAGMDSDDRIRCIKVGNEPLSADKVIMLGGRAGQRLDPNQDKASVDAAAALIEEHSAKGRVATDERLNP